MKKKFLLSLMLMVSIVLVAPSVFAEIDETEGGSTKEKTTERIRLLSEEKAAEARRKAQERLDELKTKVAERTKEVRSKACEARKKNIANRLENLYAAGVRHKGKFDAILARVDAFVEKKELVVPSGDALRAAVDAAAETVAAEAEALKELKGTVNCDDPDSVAAGLEAYRAQTAILRDALKAYREAIRAYMVAVKQAAEAVESTEGD